MVFLLKHNLYKGKNDIYAQERALIERLTEKGKSGAQMARLLGVSSAAISQRRSRMGLDKEVREEYGFPKPVPRARGNPDVVPVFSPESEEFAHETSSEDFLLEVADAFTEHQRDSSEVRWFSDRV